MGKPYPLAWNIDVDKFFINQINELTVNISDMNMNIFDILETQ